MKTAVSFLSLKKLSARLQNQNGYSFVEVLVITAILSVSFLVWGQIASFVEKSSRYPDAQVNLAGLGNAVRGALKYQSTCNKSLVGVSTQLNPASGASGSSPNQEVQIKLPGILGGSDDGDPTNDVLKQNSQTQHLTITSLKFVNVISLPSSGGTGKYFAELELSAKVTATGMALKPVNAGGVYVTTLPAINGTIQSCDTATDDPVPLCEEMGCTWDVTQTPSCVCAPVDLSCPPQQFLTGVSNSGGPICTALGSSGPCPAGTYIQGITLGAPNTCAPLP